MSRSLANLARSSARHPWRMILIWVVALVIVSSIAGRLGGEFVDDFRLPDSDAQKAADQLEESFPAQAGGSATLVFSVEDGSLRNQTNTDAIDASLAEVARLDHVVSVSDPLAAGTIASSERIGFAEVRYDRDVIDLGKDDFGPSKEPSRRWAIEACRPRSADRWRPGSAPPRRRRSRSACSSPSLCCSSHSVRSSRCSCR